MIILRIYLVIQIALHCTAVRLTYMLNQSSRGYSQSPKCRTSPTQKSTRLREGHEKCRPKKIQQTKRKDKKNTRHYNFQEKRQIPPSVSECLISCMYRRVSSAPAPYAAPNALDPSTYPSIHPFIHRGLPTSGNVICDYAFAPTHQENPRLPCRVSHLNTRVLFYVGVVFCTFTLIVGVVSQNSLRSGKTVSS